MADLSLSWEDKHPFAVGTVKQVGTIKLQVGTIKLAAGRNDQASCCTGFYMAYR
jgi:hypothetical protein